MEIRSMQLHGNAMQPDSRFEPSFEPMEPMEEEGEDQLWDAPQTAEPARPRTRNPAATVPPQQQPSPPSQGPGNRRHNARRPHTQSKSSSPSHSRSPRVARGIRTATSQQGREESLSEVPNHFEARDGYHPEWSATNSLGLEEVYRDRCSFWRVRPHTDVLRWIANEVRGTAEVAVANFAGLQLGGRQILPVLDVLRTMPRLEAINLADANLGDEAAASIAAALCMKPPNSWELIPNGTRLPGVGNDRW